MVQAVMSTDDVPDDLVWLRLRFSAWLSIFVHLLAGLAMAIVLRHGLETNPDLASRQRFLVDERGWWTAAWMIWHAAALSILYFYFCFWSAHEPLQPRSTGALRMAVMLSTAAIAADLAAEAIEIGVLPELAAGALDTAKGGKPMNDLFIAMHRTAMMLTGYVANGLYTLSAILLTWSTRQRYPGWVWVSGFVVGLSGLALSGSVLGSSVAGMFWSNVVLVPALLVWQMGVAVHAAGQQSNRASE